MKNGATIILQTSWALNTTDAASVRYMICGDKAGVDNYGGSFKMNFVCNDKQVISTPDLEVGNVSFYDGVAHEPTVEEQKAFLAAIREEKPLVTLLEKAAVVTRILEGIYTSAKTGKAYMFD